MYWFPKNKISKINTALMSFGAVIFFVSCESANQTSNNREEKYFDIPSYFENQISRFQQEDPLVQKTVITNAESEQKELKIINWTNELSAFLAVDLNKPAYQGHIKKDSIGSEVKYSFSGKDVDLKTVRILYENKNPIKIEIDKKNKNFLYQTDEKLLYIKDSLYTIEKNQKPFLMKANSYKITGIIK